MNPRRSLFVGPSVYRQRSPIYRDCFDERNGVHPADWRRENESEQR
jgi:hypothetical protein